MSDTRPEDPAGDQGLGGEEKIRLRIGTEGKLKMKKKRER